MIMHRQAPLTRYALAAATLLFTLWTPTPAGAQVEPTMADLTTSLARLETGSTVRVRTQSGDVHQGAFHIFTDSLILVTGADRRAIAFDDVRSVWHRQRETWRGARAGAAIGGLSGGAFLGLLGFVASGSTAETGTLVVIGVLGGAAAGGLLGGVVGAAVPDWTLVYPIAPGAEPVDVAVVPPVTSRSDVAQPGPWRLGAVEGAIGYGRVTGDEPTGGGPGGRIALHAEFGAEPAPGSTATFWTVGPEIGWFDLGRTDIVRRTFPPADTVDLARGFTALTAGGVLRGGIDTGDWRGYALVALAYNRWQIEEHDVVWVSQSLDQPVVTGPSRFEHLGYTAGGGVQRAVADRAAAGLEFRHTTVGTFDFDLPGSYWTVTVTGAWRW